MTTAERPSKTSLGEVITSVAAAFFGVQSSGRRKRDFTHGNPWHYVAVGLLMTAGVAGVFWAAVQLTLYLAR